FGKLRTASWQEGDWTLPWTSRALDPGAFASPCSDTEGRGQARRRSKYGQGRGYGGEETSSRFLHLRLRLLQPIRQSLHRQVPCKSTNQNKADDRDEERPEQRREEFVYTEPKAHALRNPTGQKQHECVDDEDEQAQGDDFQ